MRCQFPTAAKWPRGPKLQTVAPRRSRPGPTDIESQTKVSSLEGALAALDLEDPAAKAEVESALRRAKQGSPVARLDPDTKALAAMEDFEGPEVVSLRTAQKRAQEDGQELPLEVQIGDRDPFIKRARKRIAQNNEDRASEVRSLEEAERKLNDLKAFRTVQADPASTPLPELEQLQMRVAQLQAQNEELLSASDGQAVGSGAAPDRESQLREDVVPLCDEEVVRWMRDRLLDMQDAIAAGNRHQMARLCQVVVSTAQELAQMTPPSMVANVVRGH